MPPLASWLDTRSAKDPSVPQRRSAGLRTPDGPRFSSMGVDHGGHDVLVALQLLNGAEVLVPLQQVDGPFLAAGQRGRATRSIEKCSCWHVFLHRFHLGPASPHLHHPLSDGVTLLRAVFPVLLVHLLLMHLQLPQATV
jgi:hypothetical protein